jgi:hypothetical protein
LFGGMGELGFEGKRWDIAIDGGVGVGDSKVKKVATFAASSTVFYYNGRFLYKFWDRNEGNLDFRAGLQLGGYSAQRVTPAFLNASLVWESINTLFATAKVNWRISHTQTAGKFLFIHRNAGIRHVKFSSQLSLPLLHSVWRPGYAYIEDFSDAVSAYVDELYFKITDSADELEGLFGEKGYVVLSTQEAEDLVQRVENLVEITDKLGNRYIEMVLG